jgi:hypothetical protein
MKRRVILQSASVLALPAVANLAWAQDKYPSKPISFICPVAVQTSAHASLAGFYPPRWASPWWWTTNPALVATLAPT